MKLKIIICGLALFFVSFAFACKEHDPKKASSVKQSTETTKS